MVKHLISAHMIVGENLNIAHRFLKDALEIVDVDEFVVGVHPRCSEAVKSTLYDYAARDKIDKIVKLKGKDFSDWRNQLIEASEGSEYIWKLDADEVYDVETLNELYNVADAGVDIAYVPMNHLMRTPWERQVEDIYSIPALFRYEEGDRWGKSVHEYLSIMHDKDVQRSVTQYGFTHWGYTKPQISTFLKWCLYALLEHGDLKVYKYEGERLFLRGWRKPYTILDDRPTVKYDLDIEKFPNIFDGLDLDECWEYNLVKVDSDLYEWYDSMITKSKGDYVKFLELLEESENNWPKAW